MHGVVHIGRCGKALHIGVYHWKRMACCHARTHQTKTTHCASVMRSLVSTVFERLFLCGMMTRHGCMVISLQLRHVKLCGRCLSKGL